MNSPLEKNEAEALKTVSLEDKYVIERGRIYISGTQALVRLPMLQKERDLRLGLNTAGYISGYRGSPLGGLDLALWKAKTNLAEHDVVFQPGLNEDIAATAVWGTQQVNLYPNARYDGVFGMWYGKGPGVDRSADVLKHANAAGTAKNGGVLLLVGDDHAAKSSSVAHQSEHLLIAAGIPVLYPANVQEYLEYGLHGWAMSRYSGLWVAMKCVTDVVESTASVDIDPEHLNIVLPDDFQLPGGGLNIRWPDPPLVQERRMLDHKWYAALAYIRANKLNQVVIDSPKARFGIVSAGKAYLDVRQALQDFGLDEEVCKQVGIRVFKVGCVWPLDAQDTQDFASGLEEILVVEEKRQILEYALKEELYNLPEDVRPRVFGKFDERDCAGGEWSVPRGQWLLPAWYELSPALIANAIASRLERVGLPEEVQSRIKARVAVIDAKERDALKPQLTVERKPWFCSGCPHNTSTKLPEGSRATAGIGCHYMAMWMDRDTETFTQMGGEGATWLGQMHFSGDKHIFVNLGDGTYFHSGLLAIRAAIAANANITYKLLFNGAVAMTGGQPVDGVLTVDLVARQLLAEGAKRVVVLTDEPEKYASNLALPRPVVVHHRDEIDAVQKQLREVAGVTVLIYDQACATEKRRLRKRGELLDPARRAFINDAVCEGCGDCSIVSNCLSIEPLETDFGTKRQINQSSCNKDFSCIKGFCPSFVVAEGAHLKKPKLNKTLAEESFDRLPSPEIPAIDGTFGIVVTGVGGTGVVTIGALIGMAAHLERKGVVVLDMTGLAQKGGSVLSHIQIARYPEELYATRIATGDANLLIGCDAIVSASDEALSRMKRGATKAIVNIAPIPTADFIGNPDWKYPSASVEEEIRKNIGDECLFVDANALAVEYLGDAIYANPLILGFAWQKGWIPLGRDALHRAIELNAVAVKNNLYAFELGRMVARGQIPAATQGDPVVPGAPVEAGKAFPASESLDHIVRQRIELLTAYQDSKYAARYKQLVDKVRLCEQDILGNGRLPLTEIVARNLAKLMAYKDEYEVARLYAAPEFLEKLRAQFDGEPMKDYRLSFYLAPPLHPATNSEGRLVKRRYGSWMLGLMKVLARFKFLRGSVIDPFGRSEHRRIERQLLADYEQLLNEFCTSLTLENHSIATELAMLPEHIRGFGPIKERNIVTVKAKWSGLREKYRGS